MTVKKLLLIDGSNLMFRAYYATAYSGNLMKNSHGEYTNAVFGMANMLNLILKEEFTHILVAFDKGKSTYRHKEYEDYKAGRKPMPDEFRQQLPLIREITEKLGIFIHESEDLEADDIIGILTKKYYDDFDDIEIISNDKDLYQLLNHKVNMRISKRGLEPEKIFTEKDLMNELGITPAQVPDLKGLMGDSSDNLPGIPGVGEKTALKLLKEYETIETLLKNVNELKGKLKERVQNHGEEALKWRKLATIITDYDLGISLDDIEYNGFDEEALIEFYERLEFHTFIKRLEKTQKKESIKYTVLTNDDVIEEALDDNGYIILEAFKDNYHQAEKLGLAVVIKDQYYFIPYETLLKSKAAITYLESHAFEKYTFDLKKTQVLLKQDGINIHNVPFDLLLAAYVINPSFTKDDFKVVVSNFDYQDVPYKEDVYGKGAKQKIPAPSVFQEYAVKQAIAIQSLKEELTKQLKKQNQFKLYTDVEIPLTTILGDMEFVGVRLDLEALNAFNDQLETEIESLTKSIHDDAGETFNISSPKQLGEVLFEKLELPSYKKSKTGYSTNIDVLNKLKDKHPIIDKIIRYRSITKLQSTYVKGLKESMHDDGKIHTIYKQAFTQTGRLSSIEPNLQNIPIRTELGRDLRKVFIPEENHVLLASDYSQIELRVLAHMANEQTLIKAFKDGEDIHSITGKQIFEKDEITSNERRIAKAVNFGIIYGQSAWGLSDDLGISQKDADTFINRYYKRFSGISTFMDSIIEKAKNDGYVETMFNRRRYIPEVNSRVYQQRELGKRTAMNAPLQGSAADIIKIAMVNIDRALKKEKMKTTMILQIHDELVFTVPKDEQEKAESLITKVMEDAVELKVPLTVSLAIGDNLNEAK